MTRIWSFHSLFVILYVVSSPSYSTFIALLYGPVFLYLHFNVFFVYSLIHLELQEGLVRQGLRVGSEPSPLPLEVLVDLGLNPLLDLERQAQLQQVVRCVIYRYFTVSSKIFYTCLII